MFLSQISLAPEVLATYDLEDVHLLVYSGVSETEPRCLFRCETDGKILVQTHHKPFWEDFQVVTKTFCPVLRTDCQYDFRLRANACSRNNNTGKRVGIGGENNQVEWLRKKANGNGLAIGDLNANDEHLIQVSSNGRQMAFRSVLFNGILSVSDVDAATNVLTFGFGSGKAFGFGLISLALSTRRM